MSDFRTSCLSSLGCHWLLGTPWINSFFPFLVFPPIFWEWAFFSEDFKGLFSTFRRYIMLLFRQTFLLGRLNVRHDHWLLRHLTCLLYISDNMVTTIAFVLYPDASKDQETSVQSTDSKGNDSVLPFTKFNSWLVHFHSCYCPNQDNYFPIRRLPKLQLTAKWE